MFTFVMINVTVFSVLAVFSVSVKRMYNTLASIESQGIRKELVWPELAK